DVGGAGVGGWGELGSEMVWRRSVRAPAGRKLVSVWTNSTLPSVSVINQCLVYDWLNGASNWMSSVKGLNTTLSGPHAVPPKETSQVWAREWKMSFAFRNDLGARSGEVDCTTFSSAADATIGDITTSNTRMSFNLSVSCRL